MINNKNNLGRLLLFLIVVTVASGCEKTDLPGTVAVSPSDFYGEWKGTTVTTRALSGTNIIETPVALAETLSLRQENGKDTFNFRDPVTGMNIAGRQGTWYVTQINNGDDGSVDGARILRLRVISSATRILYTTLSVKQNDGKILVLNDGANKTLSYTK